MTIMSTFQKAALQHNIRLHELSKWMSYSGPCFLPRHIKAAVRGCDIRKQQSANICCSIFYYQ